MENKPAGSEKQPKYSIVTYLVILFVVVIALVLLSYFVQSRRDSSDLEDFRDQHMERLISLEEQVDALEAEVDQLQLQLDTALGNNGN